MKYVSYAPPRPNGEALVLLTGAKHKLFILAGAANYIAVADLSKLDVFGIGCKKHKADPLRHVGLVSAARPRWEQSARLTEPISWPAEPRVAHSPEFPIEHIIEGFPFQELGLESVLEAGAATRVFNNMLPILPGSE
jgi:hypothetical protein